MSSTEWQAVISFFFFKVPAQRRRCALAVGECCTSEAVSLHFPTGLIAITLQR